MYPLVATIGAAVNVTMLTYNGIASVGVSTDDAAVSDPDILLEALRQGFADAIGEHVPATTPMSGDYRETLTKIGQTETSNVKKPDRNIKRIHNGEEDPSGTESGEEGSCPQGSSQEDKPRRRL